MSFEPNCGQADRRYQFVSRGHGYSVFLAPAESVLALRQSGAAPARLRMRLIGASRRARLGGGKELPGKTNYFIGRDPARWRTNVPTYAEVCHRDAYPGVDLVQYGDQGRLEYDFVIAPGADPKLIRLGFEGVQKLEVDSGGELVLHIPGGEVRHRRPEAYQDLGGIRTPVRARFVLRGRREAGFEVGSYNAAQPLVIDPVLIYSTYLGGSGSDRGAGIAVDAAGNIYVTGSTDSDIPRPMGAFQEWRAGGVDAFVVKLTPDAGRVIYGTYLGGSGEDQALGIAVDEAGNAYVTGATSSTDFPTIGSSRPFGGGKDAFITKLNAMGSGLLHSTCLGGSGDDVANGIALDTAQNIFVAGETSSTNFPTWSAFQTMPGGGADAFITKLAPPDYVLVYSTYFGGSGEDSASSIATDSAGMAHVAGVTRSADFPLRNPFQSVIASPCTAGICGSDAFVAKLDGGSLVYASFLGGSGEDGANGIAIACGEPVVAGQTSSADLPVHEGSYRGGPADAFVALIGSAASPALIKTLYFGGSGEDRGTAVAADAFCGYYLTGETNSPDLPAHPMTAYGGGRDAFLFSFSNLNWDTVTVPIYLGGSGEDAGAAVAAGAGGRVFVTGRTASADFPLLGAAQSAFAGGDTDAFVAITEPCFPPEFSLILLNRENDCVLMEPGNQPVCGVDLLVQANDNQQDFALSANEMILASAKNGTGPEGRYAAENRGGGTVFGYTAMRAPGEVFLQGGSRWMGSRRWFEDRRLFQDPMRGKGQPPPPGTLASIPYLGGVIQGGKDAAGTLVLPPGNYFAAAVDPAGNVYATGNPLLISGYVRFSAGPAQFVNCVFFGGVRTQQAHITFEPGRYVFAGVRPKDGGDPNPLFDVGSGSSLQDLSLQTYQNDAGEIFIFTDSSYPGLQVPEILLPIRQYLRHGTAGFHAGNGADVLINLHGLNAESPWLLPWELEPFTPFLVWQDNRNSVIRYTPDGSLDGYCFGWGADPSPGCPNYELASPKSPEMYFHASRNTHLYGAIYQPRGSWLTVDGSGSFSAPLAIIGGALNIHANANVMLEPRPVRACNWTLGTGLAP